MTLINVFMSVFSFVEGIETLQAILFIVGILLLIVEIFTPGFGLAGGIGLILMILGIIFTAKTPFDAFVMIVILLVIVFIILAIIYRSVKRGKLSKKLILWSAAKHEDGFTTSADTSALTGKEGISLTVLRPAGSGEFDGQRLDIVTDGTFVESGVRIIIIRTEGRRIVVKPIE